MQPPYIGLRVYTYATHGNTFGYNIDFGSYLKIISLLLSAQKYRSSRTVTKRVLNIHKQIKKRRKTGCIREKTDTVGLSPRTRGRV